MILLTFLLFSSIFIQFSFYSHSFLHIFIILTLTWKTINLSTCSSTSLVANTITEDTLPPLLRIPISFCSLFLTSYETLLRFVTAIGNTVDEEKRTEYTQLYQKYYEEYQFVFKFYNDLLTQHKVDSAQSAIHYDSPLQNPSQKRDGISFTPLFLFLLATQEILDSFNKAGQAIIKSVSSLYPHPIIH